MTFFASGSLGHSFLQPPSGVIGELYNKSSWSNLSDFTASGFTPTISSNKIVFSGGNSDFLQYMVFDQYSADEKQTISVEYVWDSENPTHGASIGIGRRSTIGTAINNEMHYDPRSANKRMQFWQNGSLKGNKTIDVGAAIGHILRLTFTQNKNIITGTIENLTNGQSGSYTVTGNLAAIKNWQLTNVAKPCLWHHGGNQTIQKITLSSATLKSPLAVTIGDSKTHGYSAESAGGRWGELFAHPRVAVFGGDGDKTAECIQGISYITSRMKPQYAILAIGCNDLRSGVPPGTWQANYGSIVSQLEGAGITVIHLLPLPEAGLDQSALKSWIQSTYASGKLVDPSTGWTNAIHLSTDNVHPSYAGHNLAVQKIVDSGYLPGLSSQSGIAANATLAISFSRIVRTGYTGNAFKVRRSTDNATQVIGYVNGILDTTSLLAFIGSSNGYIEGFWDQSVHNFYFEQLTTSKQARIVNTGSLETQGGKAAPYFDGNGYYSLVNVTINSLTINHATICSVLNMVNFSSDRTLLAGDSTGHLHYRFNTAGKQEVLKQRSTSLATSTSSISGNTLTALSMRLSPSAGNSAFRKNGVADGSPTFTGFTYAQQQLYIGAAIGNSGEERFYGYLGELLAFPSSFNDSAVNAVEQNLGSHFGVSVS